MFLLILIFIIWNERNYEIFSFCDFFTAAPPPSFYSRATTANTWKPTKTPVEQDHDLSNTVALVNRWRFHPRKIDRKIDRTRHALVITTEVSLATPPSVSGDEAANGEFWRKTPLTIGEHLRALFWRGEILITMAQSFDSLKIFSLYPPFFSVSRWGSLGGVSWSPNRRCMVLMTSILIIFISYGFLLRCGASLLATSTLSPSTLTSILYLLTHPWRVPSKNYSATQCLPFNESFLCFFERKKYIDIYILLSCITIFPLEYLLI